MHKSAPVIAGRDYSRTATASRASKSSSFLKTFKKKFKIKHSIASDDCNRLQK
jgi:hypothetical protein